MAGAACCGAQVGWALSADWRLPASRSDYADARAPRQGRAALTAPGTEGCAGVGRGYRKRVNFLVRTSPGVTRRHE